jgi:hypothetical protein
LGVSGRNSAPIVRTEAGTAAMGREIRQPQPPLIFFLPKLMRCGGNWRRRRNWTFLCGKFNRSFRNFYKQLVCGVSYQIEEFIFNSNNFLFTTTSIKIVFQQQKPIETNLIRLKINLGVRILWIECLFLDLEANGTEAEMVPLMEEEKMEKMMMGMNESRRRLGSFQICALCTCCGGTKGLCLPSPCCYAINCNIPNRPFSFCSFTP